MNEVEGVSLGKQVEVISGTHVKSDKVSDDSSKTPYLTGPDDFDERGFSVTKYAEDPSSFCEPGDTLVTVKGSGCGKTTFASERVAISRQLKALRPKDDLDPQYLYYWLQIKKELLSILAQGTSIPGLSISDLTTLQISLPSLPEQRRIGNILSTVDEQIQQTDEMIEKSIELKEGLVQSLVFYGPDHDDTQSVQLGPAQTEIASSWDVASLNDVSKRVQYGSSESLSKEGEYPIFRMNNIENGRMVDSPMKYTDLSPEKAEKYRVERGDILVNRTNSIELVGKCGIFDLEGYYVFASYLIRIQTTDKMNPYFLNYYLNSHTGQGILTAYATRGASQANINATSLKSVNVPLPPRDVQDRIVDQIQTVEQKIAEEREHKHHLQDLKRGLMQDLLTGRKRVQPTTSSNDD
jgi:type I restriction enzyme S subunit